MGLPASVDGRVEIPGETDPKVVLDRLVWALKAADASAVRKDGSQITFDVDALRLVGNMNVLGPYDGGALVVSKGDSGVVVRYSASLRRMLLLVTGVVLFGLAPLLYVVSNVSAIGTVSLAIGAWVWLFGVNALIASFRFPRWVVRESGR